jgi:2-polyprenyl-6-methoxyphenol hydroxylase-like FAD-dependent oxidoreductase
MTWEGDVLIAGAGPAGLSLAADLGRRGVKCLVLEKRTQITKHPRATLLGARSMEYFRRLGVADRILAAGLPTRYRYEIVFATRIAGKLLHHYSTPSPDEYMEMAAGKRPATVDSLWSPYFKVQIGQHAIEPILRDYVKEQASVDLRYGCELSEFSDKGDRIEARATDLQTKETFDIRAKYLAACDGGRSAIRTALNIPYTGRGAMRKNISFLFRSPDFLKHSTVGRGNLYFVFSPGNFGVFTQIDDKGLWNYQHYILDPRDEENVDPAVEIRDAVGCDFEFEVLRQMHWSHHQSVANQYRSGRVFLVGDSAHLFCPTGGIGMNTAIGDAFDLSWKIAATLSGWGGGKLLDSYDAERRPIGFRNTIAAAANADRVDSMMRMTPPDIDHDTPQAAAARDELRPRFKWLSKQFSTMGLHVGYRYADSPLIVADGSAEPPDDPRIPVQSTWPGCRAPHVWLNPHRTTLDSYDGMGFVLVANKPNGAQEPFARAAQELKVPLTTQSFEPQPVKDLYERDYVLVRPDGHVCWRGDSAPTDPKQTLSTVTGH